MSSSQPKFKLSIRTMLIVLLALVAGAVAGMLTWTARAPAPQAALVGISVTALAIRYFDKIME